MRNKLELWKIIDEKFDEFFETGLCALLHRCIARNVINYYEFKIIEREMARYGNMKYDFFLGKVKDPKPRKEFIQKMIKKHSK